MQSLADVSAFSYTLIGTGIDPLANPVLSGLAAGLAEDWGVVGTSLIAQADLGLVPVAVGAAINLGAIP